jgi:hypothetical protein
MWSKISAYWDSLPHGTQAVIVAFGGGFMGVVEPVVEHWATGQPVCAIAVGACIKGYLVSGVKAGVVAVMGLYLKSSYHAK